MKDYSVAKFHWFTNGGEKEQTLIIDREQLLSLLQQSGVPTFKDKMPNEILLIVFPQLPTEIYEATLNTDLE